MTSPDYTSLIVEVRAVHDTLQALQASVGKLDRAVQGDADTNTPSLRMAVKNIKDELDNEVESLCERIDKLEDTARVQEAYLKGVLTVVKWLGGGTLAGLLGVIVLIARFVGGLK